MTAACKPLTQLRAYAARLMAFALKALGEEDEGFAMRLVTRAAQCLDDAKTIENTAASADVVQCQRVGTEVQKDRLVDEEH